jgi:hypothetical protein
MLAMITLAKAQSPSSIVMHSHDFFVVQLSYDTWVGAPDSMHIGGLSRGVNIAFMYDFPVKEGSHFSVAPGLGISSSNIFFKNQTLGIGQVSPTLDFRRDSSYKHYKLATTFLEIPIEFRYRQFSDNANKGFKAGIGLKFGTLLNAHTKGKKIVSGGKQVEKTGDKRYFQTWRVAATARIGWGNVSLFTSYSLTPLLKQTAGPKFNTLSVGLCLSGL